ncbi:hypothetical protein [Methylobacterium oxalidis]|uniref:Uncharacterized protein n=1 Tax=Methylobacterium oxalidis TaxID=944322 RepID=A0A512JBG2_9HYPH|nr:hypothetical protein [Methylobacterium oxalidis]GEP07317.1 hypothetical protein MOX02_53550 [Methylobacterium oxalidis]GLS64099.1 hypothetical protein GCM10007888_24800 [Methylobacterium oxalidis]
MPNNAKRSASAPLSHSATPPSLTGLEVQPKEPVDLASEKRTARAAQKETKARADDAFGRADDVIAVEHDKHMAETRKGKRGRSSPGSETVEFHARIRPKVAETLQRIVSRDRCAPGPLLERMVELYESSRLMLARERGMQRDGEDDDAFIARIFP